MGTLLVRIIIFPLRLLLWPFRILRLLLLKAIGKNASRTLRKSSGNYIASSQEDRFTEPPPPQDEEPIDTRPAGLESLLFRQLERPRLVERTAPDMTLEEAQFEVDHAERYYTYNFSLFPRGDFFYEEVEQEYLQKAMGLEHNATDARFIRIMTQFRRVLNDNSRRLFLYYTPLIFLICLGTSLSLGLPFWNLAAPKLVELGATPAQAQLIFAGVVSTGIFVIGLLALMVVYHWPYKVTQQRNLLGLDNYITSKFARVNQNFLVAKRRGLNVERNKRMNQAEELKEEAGIWTLAYHWFAMRLLLCEQLVRNKIYQIRRNTTLYSVGGIVVCLMLSALTIGLSMMLDMANLPSGGLLVICGFLSLVFIAAAYSLIMGRAMPEILNVMHANEWARFHQVSLHQTIADHVGEDKLQIVTFRDRNRFE